MIKLKNILKEVDELTAFPFEKGEIQYDEEDEDESILSVDYFFKTPKNKYKVTLWSGDYNPEDKTFELAFGVDKGALFGLDTKQLTGEGSVYKMIKTLAAIIESFFKQHGNDVNKVVIEGTDEKRKQIYKVLFPKYLSPNVLSKVDIK
jgi:hypothetical protein